MPEHAASAKHRLHRPHLPGVSSSPLLQLPALVTANVCRGLELARTPQPPPSTIDAPLPPLINLHIRIARFCEYNVATPRAQAQLDSESFIAPTIHVLNSSKQLSPIGRSPNVGSRPFPGRPHPRPQALAHQGPPSVPVTNRCLASRKHSPELPNKNRLRPTLTRGNRSTHARPAAEQFVPPLQPSSLPKTAAFVPQSRVHRTPVADISPLFA